MPCVLPLIPILSGLLFLRQLKEYPVDPGPKRNRWVGVTVIVGVGLGVMWAAIWRVLTTEMICEVKTMPLNIIQHQSWCHAIRN